MLFHMINILHMNILTFFSLKKKLHACFFKVVSLKHFRLNCGCIVVIEKLALSRVFSETGVTQVILLTQNFLTKSFTLDYRLAFHLLI